MLPCATRKSSGRAEARSVPMKNAPTPNVDDLIARLRDAGYLADRDLGTALELAAALGRPLLLEGEAGVGKTEAGRALASAHDAQLVRLQCYEGLDLYAAGYDWSYAKQLLAIRRAAALGEQPSDLYGDEYLLRRPLLQALGATRACGIVLLVDEIDRADDEFEAYLLEYLQDFALTIPERGTISALHPPLVVLTSNRTRDLHDALKRRCLYHWIEHPSLEREIEILRLRVPAVSPQIARDVAAAVARLRKMPLRKTPGISETLDWAEALHVLGAERLDVRAASATLGTVVKYPEDLERARAALDGLAAS